MAKNCIFLSVQTGCSVVLMKLEGEWPLNAPLQAEPQCDSDFTQPVKTLQTW